MCVCMYIMYIYILWLFQWVTGYFWVAGDWLKGVVAHLNVIMALYKRLGQRWERGGWACAEFGLFSFALYFGSHEGYGRSPTPFDPSPSGWLLCLEVLWTVNGWTTVFHNCYIFTRSLLADTLITIYCHESWPWTFPPFTTRGHSPSTWTFIQLQITLRLHFPSFTAPTQLFTIITLAPVHHLSITIIQSHTHTHTI